MKDTNTVGQMPPITVRFPRDFPLENLAFLAAQKGYVMRWIPPDFSRLTVRKAVKTKRLREKIIDEAAAEVLMDSGEPMPIPPEPDRGEPI